MQLAWPQAEPRTDPFDLSQIARISLLGGLAVNGSQYQMVYSLRADCGWPSVAGWIKFANSEIGDDVSAHLQVVHPAPKLSGKSNRDIEAGRGGHANPTPGINQPNVEVKNLFGRHSLIRHSPCNDVRIAMHEGICRFHQATRTRVAEGVQKGADDAIRDVNLVLAPGPQGPDRAAQEDGSVAQFGGSCHAPSLAEASSLVKYLHTSREYRLVPSVKPSERPSSAACSE